MKKMEKAYFIYRCFAEMVLDIKDTYINYLVVEKYHMKQFSYYNASLHFQACILNFYAIFQKFLCKIFRKILKDNALQYFGSEQILFSKLYKYKYNKTNLINDLIEEKINNFTRGTSDISNLCKNLGIINLGALNELKIDYEEFCARRNIYAHGIDHITKEYLIISNEVNNSWLKDNKLVENQEYIVHCMNLIYKLFFQLYYDLDIITKEKIDRSIIESLNTFIYEEFYNKGNWEVSKYIYARLKNIKCKITKANTTLYKQMYFVNFLHSCKMLGENVVQKIKNIKFRYDYKKYEIVKNAILEENKLVYEGIIALQKQNTDINKSISIENVNTWPVFNSFRCSDYYKKLLMNLSTVSEIKEK